MTKRLKSLKLWFAYVAFSCALIIAGIVLYALLGFNAATNDYKTFEVRYNVVAVINNKEGEIRKICEEEFEKNGLKFEDRQTYQEVSASNNSETTNVSLVYKFQKNASSEALEKAKNSAKERFVFANTEGTAIDVESTVSLNTISIAQDVYFNEGWRAAVAIAVGAVVVLGYIGVRFGVASALSGLCGVVNAVFLTLGVFAIARIPVLPVAPLLYAAIAAITFVLFWLLHCMKMRENFKNPEFAKYESCEAVAQSLKTSDNLVYFTAGGIGIAVVAIGGGAASVGVMLLMFPALIAVVASLYSASLLAPSVHMYCKRCFDKIKKSKVRTYSGKKKLKEEAGETEQD